MVEVVFPYRHDYIVAVTMQNIASHRFFMKAGMLILAPLFLALLVQQNALAQNLSQDSTLANRHESIVPWRMALVGGSAAAFIVAGHVSNYRSWWKGTRGPFHLSVDDRPPLGADKAGHFLFAFYGADLFSSGSQWAGMNRTKALWYGAGLAFAFQLYVEVEDGFHPDLGFSFGDLVADGLGAGYPLLRNEFPFLNSISPKWSANPSTRYGQHVYRKIFDDYESQYYWLSFNLSDLLGNRLPSFIPAFLNIAVGYGVTNLDLKGSGDREFYLALDCDFSKLPGNSDLLNALKHVANYFHCPAPMIRLTPTVIAWGVRF